MHGIRAWPKGLCRAAIGMVLALLGAATSPAASAACGSDVNCRTLTPEEAAFFVVLKEKLEGLMPQPDPKTFTLSQAEPNFYLPALADRGQASGFATARVRCRSYPGGCFPDAMGDTDSQITYANASASAKSKSNFVVVLRAWSLPVPRTLGPGSGAKRGPGFFSLLDLDSNPSTYHAYVGQRQHETNANPIRLKTPPAGNLMAPAAFGIRIHGPKEAVQAFADKVDLAAVRDLLGAARPTAVAAASPKDSKPCSEERQKVSQLEARINKNWDALDAKKAGYKHLLQFEQMAREQWERDQVYDGPTNAPRPTYEMDWQKASDESAAFRKELAPLRPVQYQLLKERYALSATFAKACGAGA
jgi:hypothetical protein